MYRASATIILVLLPGLVLAQPGSETERKRREIEQQLRLPKTPKAPARPAPAAPEKPPETAPAPEPPAPVGSAPGTPEPPAPPAFVPELHRIVLASCRSCHSPEGTAAASRLVLQGAARADYDTVRAFADLKRPAESALVTKAAGQMHGGGPITPAGSRPYRRLIAWIAAGTPFEAPAPGAPPAPPPPPIAPPARRPRPSPPVPAPPTEVDVPAAETAPAAPALAPGGPDFVTAVEPVLTIACRACHNPDGVAAASRLHLSGEPAADFAAVLVFVNTASPAESPLVTKGAGVMHGGGAILPATAEGYRTLVAWIAAGARGPATAPTATAAPGPGPAPAPAASPGSSARPAPPKGAHAPHGASPHGPGGPGGLPLPFGFQLNGRFDLNYERRGMGRDTSFGDATNALRSYHHFLFLSRGAESDPIGLTVELITLQIWEGTFRHRFQKAPLGLTVRAGKILVPFGNDPLFHQAYGGTVGFDQEVLPPVWAQEGASAGLVFRHKRVSFSGETYVVRGYRLRQPDDVINLQNDFSPFDDVKLGVGGRLGASWGPLTAFYSAYVNPLGFDRTLFMQAVDLGLWRPQGIPVLDRLAVGAGFLRADVSGGGHGLDYYQFASYWQARLYATNFLYLQYRQGLRTFNNRRGVIVDETRLESDDGSTHMVGLVARHAGLSGGIYYFINLEKAGEVDDDFLRLTVVYEF